MLKGGGYPRTRAAEDTAVPTAAAIYPDVPDLTGTDSGEDSDDDIPALCPMDRGSPHRHPSPTRPALPRRGSSDARNSDRRAPTRSHSPGTGRSEGSGRPRREPRELVCYEFRKTGACTRPGCTYSHNREDMFLYADTLIKMLLANPHVGSEYLRQRIQDPASLRYLVWTSGGKMLQL